MRILFANIDDFDLINQILNKNGFEIRDDTISKKAIKVRNSI